MDSTPGVAPSALGSTVAGLFYLDRYLHVRSTAKLCPLRRIIATITPSARTSRKGGVVGQQYAHM